MVFVSPKNTIVNFLRANLTDPRSRAEVSTTEEFNGGSTDFTLTPSSGSLSCVTAVTVDSVAQTLSDYYIDFQNQKVIFYSNTASGTNNVDITYKYGTTNWIFPDKPKKSLGLTSFPRINVLIVGGTGERLGQYNSNIESVFHFQIDIWGVENQVFTIDGVKYANDKLTEYLAYQVLKAFNENINELHPTLYNLTVLSVPRDLSFNSEMEKFHHVVEIELKGVDIEI